MKRSDRPIRVTVPGAVSRRRYGLEHIEPAAGYGDSIPEYRHLTFVWRVPTSGERQTVAPLQARAPHSAIWPRAHEVDPLGERREVK